MILKNAVRCKPCLSSKKVSYPNDEKVLKPPQKPVKINSLSVACPCSPAWFKIALFEITHMVIAKIVQATIFETKVAQGNDVVILRKPKPIMYLRTQPIPPPINTNKKFIILSYNFSNLRDF